mmetsp:Transcript_100019/g.250773  ORF Transcript_100019/g.250773 Transcript_100019/m.250773 type:complete len:85 (-) Transcript_100019:2-256(-)
MQLLCRSQGCVPPLSLEVLASRTPLHGYDALTCALLKFGHRSVLMLPTRRGRRQFSTSSELMIASFEAGLSEAISLRVGRDMRR